MVVAYLSMFRLNMRYTYSGSWENEKAAVPLALYCEDDFRRVNLLQQPREGNFLSWFFSYENLLKGRLSHCEDHKPSDPKLQALHHGERQPHHLGASKIT